MKAKGGGASTWASDPADASTANYLSALGSLALPVPEQREVFARLLQASRPSPERMAEQVSRVLRSTEEARICHRPMVPMKIPPGRGLPAGWSGFRRNRHV